MPRALHWHVSGSARAGLHRRHAILTACPLRKQRRRLLPAYVATSDGTCFAHRATSLLTVLLLTIGRRPEGPGEWPRRNCRPSGDGGFQTRRPAPCGSVGRVVSWVSVSGGLSDLFAEISDIRFRSPSKSKFQEVFLVVRFRLDIGSLLVRIWSATSSDMAL